MRSFLAKHWFLLVLTVGLGFTLLWPDRMKLATVYWEPNVTVAISLFLIAWTMPTLFLIAELRQPAASLWAVFLSYALVPFAAWLLGHVAPSKDVAIGLILVSSVPCTLSSAVLWTRLAGGNEATTLLAVMGSTFTSWFLTTALLYGLTGTTLELNVGKMMLDLIMSLIAPVVLGQALRLHSVGVRFADRFKVMLGVVSQILILAIVLKAGVAVGEKLHEQSVWDAPAIFLGSIALAVSLHLFSLGSGLITCRWLGFNRGRRIAVAFAASQKTLPISLMFYDQYFKHEYPYAVMPILFYHVGQLLLDTLIARQLFKGAGPAQEIPP